MPSLVQQPPEWIDSAPVRVSESIDIEAPPGTVWAIIADHESWSEWFDDLDRVEITGDAAGVGGQRRVTARRMAVDEVFTAWDENEHFAFAVTGMPVPVLTTMAESVRIEPTDTGCRVTYSQGIQGRRGLGWLAGLVGRQLAPSLKAALVALKERAEA